MSELKIAIIGGGPGGLTLASLFTHHSIPYKLFELDSSRTARSHLGQSGGTLDIHHDLGQDALKAAGLLEKFKTLMRVDGTALKLLDNNGQVLFDDPGEPEEDAHRPEIDRAVLRDLLLDSLHPDSISWGKKLVNVGLVEGSAKFDLHFSDGSIEREFDLVVGADGAWSQVRPLLTDVKPFYSGITCIEFRTSSSGGSIDPRIDERVGRGSAFQFGDGTTALMSQRNGDESIRTYAMLRVGVDWLTSCGIDWSDSQKARERLVQEELVNWDQVAKDMILKSDADHLVTRHLYMLPIGIRWKSRPGITILGDAAHLMTPYAGVGVNLAMKDALELFRSIQQYLESKSGITLEGAVKAYEESMFAYAEKYAQETMTNLEIFHSGDQPLAIVEKLKAAMGGPEEEHST